MTIPLILFLVDLLSTCYFQQWLIYSLVAYCMLQLTIKQETLQQLFITTLPTLLLIAFQNVLIYDRFGLMLIFIIPLLYLGFKLNNVVLYPSLLLPVFVGYFFLCEDVIIKKLLFLQNLPLEMTIQKIFTTIVVGYIILWGTLGNRSLQ